MEETMLEDMATAPVDALLHRVRVLDSEGEAFRAWEARTKTEPRLPVGTNPPRWPPMGELIDATRQALQSIVRPGRTVLPAFSKRHEAEWNRTGASRNSRRTEPHVLDSADGV